MWSPVASLWCSLSLPPAPASLSKGLGFGVWGFGFRANQFNLGRGGGFSIRENRSTLICKKHMPRSSRFLSSTSAVFTNS